MAELAQRQLKDVLDAYADRNAEAARLVWEHDEQIDATYNSVFLLTYMMEDPRNIGLCTHLLFGAKNLERIGDHATSGDRALSGDWRAAHRRSTEERQHKFNAAAVVQYFVVVAGRRPRDGRR